MFETQSHGAPARLLPIDDSPARHPPYNPWNSAVFDVPLPFASLASSSFDRPAMARSSDLSAYF